MLEVTCLTWQILGSTLSISPDRGSNDACDQYHTVITKVTPSSLSDYKPSYTVLFTLHYSSEQYSTVGKRKGFLLSNIINIVTCDPRNVPTLTNSYKTWRQSKHSWHLRGSRRDVLVKYSARPPIWQPVGCRDVILDNDPSLELEVNTNHWPK